MSRSGIRENSGILANSTTPLEMVLVSSARDWQGGEEQAALLLRGLVARGHQCRVLARQGSEFARRLDSEFDVETYSTAIGGVASWGRLRRMLSRRPLDVLHYNDPHALCCVGPAAWRLPIGARIVARRSNFPLRSSRPYRWFADRVLCVSRAAAESCRQAGVPGAMLSIVSDGVDPARVLAGNRARGRAALHVTEHDQLLLCVGKLTPCKGHGDLFAALPSVFARFPRAVLALAGDGELAGSLAAEAKRLNLAERVRFLGYRTDVPDLIQACDLFVFPSREEGLGSSLIDVMLAGRPIVATTAGGIPDLLGPRLPKSIAWQVPPADPEALSAAVGEALSSPLQAAERAERARQRARERFTADEMIDTTLAVYRKLAASATAQQKRRPGQLRPGRQTCQTSIFSKEDL